MARPRNIPEGAEIVRSYEQLDWFFTAFAEGHFSLLIVVGPPGMSKSASIKEALKGVPFSYIHGYSRPIQAFIRGYETRGQPQIIDDAQGLLETAEGRNLLTHWTQTNRVKTLEWSSSSKILSDLGVPMRYSTTSSVCIITNRWSGTSKEIAALEDRGHLIYFDPTPLEVHRFVSTWLQPAAQDVYDFVGKNLHRIDRPSCRLYVKAVERKAAGGDWRAFILHHCHRNDVQVVQEIIADPSFASCKDRVNAAKAKVGISRATFYRIKKELDENGQRQPIRPYALERTKLKSTPRPEGNQEKTKDDKLAEMAGPKTIEGKKMLKLAEFRET